MIYCMMIITKEEPSNSDIGRIMFPYYIENPDRYSPYFKLPPLSLSYDYYCIGGRYSNLLQLKDGSTSSCANVSDIINFNELDCYFCIDENNGVAIERESIFGTDNDGDDRVFVEELSKIKKNSQNCFVTILEVHV